MKPVKIKDETHKALKQEALDNDLTLQEILEKIIKKYLNGKKHVHR